MKAAFRDRIQFWRFNLKEFALVAVSTVFSCPQAENDIDSFLSPRPALARVEPHQGHVCWNAAEPDAPLKAPPRQMIEHGETVRS